MIKTEDEVNIRQRCKQQQFFWAVPAVEDGDLFFFTLAAAASDGDFFTGRAAFLEPTASDGDFFTGAAAFFAPAAEDGDFFANSTTVDGAFFTWAETFLATPAQDCRLRNLQSVEPKEQKCNTVTEPYYPRCRVSVTFSLGHINQ
jgi:hypothetical protein